MSVKGGGGSDVGSADLAVLPRHLVATGSLLRPNRRPAAELAGDERRAAIHELGARRAAHRIHEIVAAVLHQAGRSKILDHYRRQNEVARYKSCFVDIL